MTDDEDRDARIAHHSEQLEALRMEKVRQLAIRIRDECPPGHLIEALKEEAGRGFDDASAAALTLGAIKGIEADEDPGPLEAVQDLVIELGNVYAGRRTDEHYRRAAALTPGLRSALDALMSSGPGEARDRMGELQLMARNDLLSKDPDPSL